MHRHVLTKLIKINIIIQLFSRYGPLNVLGSQVWLELVSECQKYWYRILPKNNSKSIAHFDSTAGERYRQYLHRYSKSITILSYWIDLNNIILYRVSQFKWNHIIERYWIALF